MSRGLGGLKRWVRWGLVGVLAVDAVLLLIAWRSAASHPQSEQQALERLRERHRLLGADVRRASEIRRRLPEVERECNRFFEAELLDSASGYSSVVEDLGKIAGKAGLPANSVMFKQRDIEKRGIAEVELTTTVDGDYPSLVRFINGLERSQNLYLLDSLSLVAGQEGRIKLNVSMRTYFRSK